VTSVDNDLFQVDVQSNYVRLRTPFTIYPGITLPVGAKYSFTRVAVSGQTASLRTLALTGRFEWGGFYSGQRQQTVLRLTIRARPGYIFTVNGEWNQVNRQEGRFSSNLVRLTTDSQFSPYAALVNIVQYDTISRVMGSARQPVHDSRPARREQVALHLSVLASDPRMIQCDHSDASRRR
jgi:hypothetical protein